MRSVKVWSHPASAAVTIDLKADTASASRSLDGFKRQLQALQSSAAASENSFASRWGKTSAEKRMTLGLGALTFGADIGASVIKGAGGSSEMANALRSATNGAKQFATMLTPLGPQAAAAGVALGLVGNGRRKETGRVVKRPCHGRAGRTLHNGEQREQRAVFRRHQA